ncbi:PhnD/SsuA/transferrin family substrate-binding protein [Ignatzschineria rhizosphaerae]|uniref:histidine kinase n=1 Tax=Ignatzschineria rhizosphaerae TaxID=2923279 RepID=A0ABY3X437_9GAMM|nr:PhnD/SsuA/transferrin family substrate-binding protein [Ignatzschineria rhizosphaerae]UNM96640.1 PhnD/SsuA/transferrin family substrate-binding protein [Ignatzschineria rhizosphaerae]
MLKKYLSQHDELSALLKGMKIILLQISKMRHIWLLIMVVISTLNPSLAQVSKNALDLLQQQTLQQTSNLQTQCSPSHKSEDTTRITIGVLAPYGDATAEREWCAWIQALNSALPELHFILKPLQINNIEAEVNSGAIDLLLSHQGVFVNLQTNVPVRWVASLEENIHLEDTNAKIGSSIWVNEESPIETLSDLYGKNIGAVSTKALGGFLLAYHEMMQNVPELRKNIYFQYHGFPIETLFNKLADHQNDAIIVPACLYERLERQDILPKGNFRLINPKQIEGFDCQTSTNLLPSWSLAALDSLDSDIAKSIQAELFRAADPTLPTWQLPYTLAEISQLTYDVKFYEGQETLFETLFRLAVTNKIWLLFFALFLLILLINHLWLSYAATKRRKQLDLAYKMMHDYEAMLSKADRMNILGEMASGIGHELNQPLSTIRNYAEGSIMILKKERENHPLLMPMQKINEQVSQCHNIIKNLRSWAKPKESSIREAVNLKLFLERIIEITRLRIRNDINISVNIPDDFTIILTPSILEQVIANCLMNSAQAGATLIEIRSKIYPKYIKLFIFDNGPGFDEAELNAPFVPFRTSKEDGLGLGLVICQRLIESIDGKLRIDNRKDGKQGAAVRLILSRELTLDK